MKPASRRHHRTADPHPPVSACSAKTGRVLICYCRRSPHAATKQSISSGSPTFVWAPRVGTSRPVRRSLGEAGWDVRGVPMKQRGRLLEPSLLRTRVPQRAWHAL